jgi:hypothetical protein
MRQNQQQIGENAVPVTSDPSSTPNSGTSVLTPVQAIALLKAHPTMFDDVRVVTASLVQNTIAELFVSEGSQLVHIRIKPERIQAPFSLQFIWDYIALADPCANIRDGISLATWGKYLHSATVAHIGRIVESSIHPSDTP